MSTIIDKIINLVTKETKKIPQVMIIILIFSALFPNEAERVIDILSTKSQIFLPESFTRLLTKLQPSQEDLLVLCTSLLIINAITSILTIINQVLEGYRYISLADSSKTLFEVNTIIFLSILIYNSIYTPRIEFPSVYISGFYLYAVQMSFILFIVTFFITYCNDIIVIYRKINNSNSSHKKLILKIIFWFVISCLLFKIYFLLPFKHKTILLRRFPL